ncbi:MAG: endonuclease/exonuclease/phosphatase family protein [Candidatus Nanopelagicales bacterium]
MRVRVGTYNVLHGLPVLGAPDESDLEGARAGVATTDEPRPHRPSDGRAGPPVVADDGPLRAAVAALDADVLGLQEIDSGQPRSGHHHQVRSAAEAMGADHWYFAPSVRGTPGEVRDRWERPDAEDERRANQASANHRNREPSDRVRDVVSQGSSDGIPPGGGPLYGVGLVSRLPVLEWRTTLFDPAPFALPLLVHAHPRPRLMLIPDEPRAAIAAVVSGTRGVFTVATVHLSFVPGYNVHQLRQLRTWLCDLPRPLVVLGDLNLPGSLPARVTGWAPLAHGATYPASRPRVQLDHVLADGLSTAEVAGARSQVHQLPVSDHCAVTVEVEL